MISPALKEFKTRSEKPSEGCSKKRVEGDGTPACSLVGPGSAPIPAQEAWGHPRICVARPLSQAGLVNQAAALAGSVRLPLVSGPRGDPRLGCLRVPAPPHPPPAAVSLFSDVTRRPRPSTPILAPRLRLLAPETQQPLKPRPSKAPPAARPGLRPLALSPTCLCYSSSLPRLASDTAADCKTRSAEPPPHLESEAGAGPKPPQLARGGECARARVFVSNPGCAGADYDLGLRVPQIMSRGAEGKGYGRGRGRMCLSVYLNVRI